MKHFTRSILAAGMVLGAYQSATAAEGGESPFSLINRLRVEWDDNVYESNTDKQDSFNIINDLELMGEFSGEQTFLGLRYMPSFVWYSDRADDDTDIHHQFDASLRHAFSPNVELNFKEVLRYAEVPELIEDDVQVRENNDYLYNSTNAGLAIRTSPRFGFDVEGRYESLAYDDNDIAKINDWDKTVGGVNLNYFLSQASTLSVEGRYTDAGYDDDIRSYTGYQAGAGINSQVNKGLFADLRGGFEERSFEDVDMDDSSDPYVSGGLTLVPNDDTRFNLGASYALAQTPSTRFVVQNRTSVQAGVSRDVTARLTANASASYSTGDFESDAAVDGQDGVSSGTEDVTRFSVRLTFEVSKSNYLEAGYQYTELASDVRPENEYDRSRVSLGWKTILK